MSGNDGALVVHMFFCAMFVALLFLVGKGKPPPTAELARRITPAVYQMLPNAIEKEETE